MSEGVFFSPSSDFISLCRCGQSNHTALGYAECVLVNAHLAGPFCHQELPVVSLYS